MIAAKTSSTIPHSAFTLLLVHGARALGLKRPKAVKMPPRMANIHPMKIRRSGPYPSLIKILIPGSTFQVSG
jgi:hypothetical protein